MLCQHVSLRSWKQAKTFRTFRVLQRAVKELLQTFYHLQAEMQQVLRSHKGENAASTCPPGLLDRLARTKDFHVPTVPTVPTTLIYFFWRIKTSWLVTSSYVILPGGEQHQAREKMDAASAAECWAHLNKWCQYRRAKLVQEDTHRQLIPEKRTEKAYVSTTKTIQKNPESVCTQAATHQLLAIFK